MKKATSGLLIAGFLAIVPARAATAEKIQLCIRPGDTLATMVILRAEVQTTRMLATARVAVQWHFAGSAGCPGTGQAEPVTLDFIAGTPVRQHPGALAFARPYRGSEIVVLIDRVEHFASSSKEIPNVLAHVMTHEITHLLEGTVRHSTTGVMKARWDPRDFQLMAQHPLPFDTEDLELIQAGLGRRR
jgi:hypothetical protein